MSDARLIRNVLLKALLLFVALNLIFAAADPLAGLGRISAYNTLLPGRERLPFGENPSRSYNLSLYSLEAMLASHQINGARKGADEFRVLLVGDSSVWGTLLRPEQTLAGQLNAAGLKACGAQKNVRVFNLGYPTISLTKDLMLLDAVGRYQPDLIVWLTTLEAFPIDKQLSSPLTANNPQRVLDLSARFGLNILPSNPALVQSSFWDKTIIGRRRALADLLRLQAYGVLWGATGIDQEYPQNYPAAERNLENDASYHGWQPPDLNPDWLAYGTLAAGMRAAAPTPVLLVNEPMLISTGQNSAVRYNFFYPRWAYDQYRQQLAERSQAAGWHYLDLWDIVPENEFTNSAIHLTPAGEGLLAQRVGTALTELTCP